MRRQPQSVSNGRTRPGPLPLREWNSLKIGDRVEVWSMDLFLYTAHVDDRTDDGQVVCVMGIPHGVRRLFLRRRTGHAVSRLDRDRLPLKETDLVCPGSNLNTTKAFRMRNQAIKHVEVLVTERNQLHELLTGAEASLARLQSLSVPSGSW